MRQPFPMLCCRAVAELRVHSVIRDAVESQPVHRGLFLAEARERPLQSTCLRWPQPFKRAVNFVTNLNKTIDLQSRRTTYF